MIPLSAYINIIALITLSCFLNKHFPQDLLASLFYFMCGVLILQININLQY